MREKNVGAIHLKLESSFFNSKVDNDHRTLLRNSIQYKFEDSLDWSNNSIISVSTLTN